MQRQVSTLLLAIACGTPSDETPETPSDGTEIGDPSATPAALSLSPPGAPDPEPAPTPDPEPDPTPDPEPNPAPQPDPRRFGPTPPIPEALGRPEPADGAALDVHETFPLEAAHVIALARVESVEDICDSGLFYDRQKTDPICNRQVVTFLVEDGLKGAAVGERLLVLKQHTRISAVSHGPSDAWSAPPGELMLLMLQPANGLGIREPLYARSHFPEGVVRAAWIVGTPRGMTKPLLVAPNRNYYACAEDSLIAMSSREAEAHAQRLISSPDFQAPVGESPMLTYEREVNGALKAAWADRSCEPAALGTLLRNALP